MTELFRSVYPERICVQLDGEFVALHRVRAVVSEGKTEGGTVGRIFLLDESTVDRETQLFALAGLLSGENRGLGRKVWDNFKRLKSNLKIAIREGDLELKQFRVGKEVIQIYQKMNYL